MSTERTPKSRGLVGNSFALLALTNVTSVLGFVYWTLCARHVSPGAIGIANTVISGITLVAIVCVAGFLPFLTRLLPGASSDDRSGLCSTAFVVTAIASGTVGAVGAFLLPTRVHTTVGTGWLVALLVTGSVATAMQMVINASLLGVRRAEFSLYASSAGAVLRLGTIASMVTLGALAATIDSGATHTMLVIYVASLVVSDTIAFVLLRRANPDFRFRPRMEWLTRISRTVGWDHVAVLAVRSPAFIMPILAAAIFPARQLGHYAVTVMIASVFLAVSAAVSNALLADCAGDPGRLQAQARRAMLLIGVLLVVPVTGTCVFAKQVLGFFGSEYTSCSTLLIVLLMATFPDAMINISMSIFRVQGRLRIITLLTVTQAIMMVGGAWFLMLHTGVIGAALAAVVAQTITAAVFAAVGTRRFLFEAPPVAPLTTPVPTPDPLIAGRQGLP
ncbi:lipopolysaccharide biosynthesis protein [Mycobacterium sp. 4D054]|uniref:lipopolysaccharide biosynthesis protein n=1 Tax=Mycobacterium sp. 4D054 TaxID=3457440 RepID=UPI003FD57BE7